MKIIRTLQECAIMFGNFIYKISDSDKHSQNESYQEVQLSQREVQFNRIEAYLKAENDEINSQEPSKKNRSEFQTYFLKIHASFKLDLEKSNAKEFFDVVEGFL